MTGRELTEKRYHFEKQGTGVRPVLRAENLVLKGGRRDISFELLPGEILGITGLLGSGKTELALALFGLRTIASGHLFIDDVPVRLRSARNAIDHGIALVPEDRLTEGLFLGQSIENNIGVTMLAKLSGKLGFLCRNAMRSLAGRWLTELNVVAASGRMAVRNLSGGNQQKIVLAKWLATKARILILISPTAGVDIGAKTDIHERIRDLAGKGMAVMIISDDIPEILQTCNRILLMHDGEIIEEYATSACDENQLFERMSQLP
jgi:simple sugar transport system ATP-binding protein